MKTVLVTGAAGYIGSILVPKLLEKGYRVIALDRFFFGINKLKKAKNLLVRKEDSRRIPKELFIDVYAVIDLVAISNDPSGEKFENATWEINFESRVRTATLAKEMGVKRYILPSSASIYGFQDNIVDENSKTNPLTTYAKANEKAEAGVLKLSDDSFCVTVMRQSTVFGYSPRMRFDLAINGMTYGAWKNKKLPLMRDGKQYRPMIHIEDTTDVMCLLLETKIEIINNEIYNVGHEDNNYQLSKLGEEVSLAVSKELDTSIDIEWYGAPDHRSYKLNFNKIKKQLGWEPKWDALMGAKDIVKRLNNGTLDYTEDCITLNWYSDLIKWHKIIKDIELNGEILDINKSK